MLSLQQSGASSQFPPVHNIKAQRLTAMPAWRRARLDACARAPVPRWLAGFVNTLCYYADAENRIAWTVKELADLKHYLTGRRLSERSVQYRERVLQSVGVLELEPGRVGRGYRRTYRLYPERLHQLAGRRYPQRDPAWPKAAPPQKGAAKGCSTGRKRVQRGARIHIEHLMKNTLEHRTRAPARAAYMTGCMHEPPCSTPNQCGWRREADLAVKEGRITREEAARVARWRA